MKSIIVSVVILFFSSATQAMDIATAYRMIPHAQTPFYLKQSNLPRSEARYISRLLSLSELAMAERVEAMANGVSKSNYAVDIEKILNQLTRLDTPKKLLPVYNHIFTAIQQHQAFFALKSSTGSNNTPKQQQLVQTSHRHLISAYQILMQLYPEESKHNKKAFFDYLCALDFI